MINRIGIYFRTVEQIEGLSYEVAVTEERWSDALTFNNRIYEQIFNNYCAEKDKEKKKSLLKRLKTLARAGRTFADEIFMKTGGQENESS